MPILWASLTKPLELDKHSFAELVGEQPDYDSITPNTEQIYQVNIDSLDSFDSVD